MSLFELRADRSAPASRARRGAGIVATAGRPGRVRRGTPWWTLGAIAVLAASGFAAAIGTVLVNGDSVWHLVWGRALAEGTLESFAMGPTPHPSLLVLGAATSLLGNEASYLITYVIFGPLAFGALNAAVFDVARRLSSPWAASLAVVILATSGAVVSMTAAARYDIAFAALVMAAVALEMARPRRLVAPLACLAVAGLIRPEAWVLAGAYWLWRMPGASWSARARTAALVVVAPALWATMDLLVTGDPLYSLHVTDEASEVLYGRYTPRENLEAAGRNLIWYLGVVPLLLLPPAAVLLARDRPRGALAPLGALVITLGLFLLLLSQGMASSERYLLVPVCVFTVLAATMVDGGGRRTRPRVMLGVFLLVIVCIHVAIRADEYETVGTKSAISQGMFESAGSLVAVPGVREALRRCPRVSIAGQRPWFAFHSGLAVETLALDGRGRTKPDLYIAPGNPAVAKAVLTRTRFDDDASFRVPPGLRPGPRNADWQLYVSPTSACTRGLR